MEVGEAALRVSQERYRLLAAAVEREHREHLAILHAVGEGVTGVDLQVRCTFVNRAAATLSCRTANPGGSGLGLAIVRKAAERLGGTAGEESRAGDGATFWIELPAAAP